jgi:methylmalonyl-CoA mutase N-terminal domain/subunit
LTDEIEKRAGEYIRKIDDLGGARAAIEQGYVQSEIQQAAYRAQRAIEQGEELVVGVNAFQVDERLELERLQVDPTIEEGQRARLAALRARREAGRTSELLTRLETAARGSENLLPLLVECVENDLTLGEICGVLRQAWGEYQPPAWI